MNLTSKFSFLGNLALLGYYYIALDMGGGWNLNVDLHTDDTYGFTRPLIAYKLEDTLNKVKYDLDERSHREILSQTPFSARLSKYGEEKSVAWEEVLNELGDQAEAAWQAEIQQWEDDAREEDAMREKYAA